jgi:hypothetical protein
MPAARGSLSVGELTEADDDAPAEPLNADEPEPGVIDELHRNVTAALTEPYSLASKRILNRAFERELDELHTPDGSSYFSERRPARSDEERKKRDERLMMAAVTKAAGEVLRSHGIRVVRTLRDGEDPAGGGYFVKARDQGGRDYTARFGLELAERLVASGGHVNLVERMGHAVAREVLAERDRYFSRMS